MLKDKLKSLRGLDYPMLFIIFLLIFIGMIILASASSYSALSTYSDSNYFLLRQLGFGVLGIICMLIVSKIDYNIYKKFAYIGYIVTAMLMVAVLVPGIGVAKKGATRWLGVGTFTFQPSEIMKIVLVIAISTFLALNYKKLINVVKYLPVLIMLGVVCIIMYFQNHLSGTVIMIAGAVSVIFISGIKIDIKKLLVIILILGLCFGAFIAAEPFRMNRITSFINPEQDLKGDNWQAAQSLYAIGTGGIFGLGLGQSRQKFLWLPEAQNDFIFSVLGEELGLVRNNKCFSFIYFFYI